MGGGHPGLAAIAARSEVSPINRRIVLTARPFCRSRILEHARPDRGLRTAAPFSSFAASVRMTRHSSTAVRRRSTRPLRKNSRPSAQRVGKRYAVGEDLCTDHTVSTNGGRLVNSRLDFRDFPSTSWFGMRSSTILWLKEFSHETSMYFDWRSSD
jgi:hypothetical protein